MEKLHIDTEGLETRLAEIARTFAHQVAALMSGAMLPKTSAPFRGGRRKRSWPNCGEPGCTELYYPASGTARHCYKHFIASGGRHPSKMK